MGRRNQIAKDIILTIGIVGFITFALVLPGLPAAFAPLFKSKKYTTKQLRQSLYKLKKNKLIGISSEGNKTVVKLTKNGRERLLKYRLEDMRMVKPKKWDKKWRLVIFDIPENLKVNRTVFSRKLRELGFVALQKSVWVWPFECEDEIDFLKTIFEISPYVRIVRADYIDVQNDLIRRFDLTSV